MPPEKTEAPTSDNGAVPIRVEDGNFPMDDMRQFSLEQTEKEEAEIAKSSPKKKKEAEPDVEIEETYEEGDDSEVESEEEAEEEAEEKDPAKKEESEEGEEDDAADEGDAEEEEDADAGDSEDADDADDESDEDSDSKGGKYLTAKDGEKSYKVPKDAVLEIKIDGETEQITVQEALNKASGVINIERQTSELGREKKKFVEEKTSFEKERNDTQANAQLLLHIAENGTPEDFCQLYGILTGKDPDEVLTKMVDSMAKYADQFSGMTERERQLYNENRKLKFRDGLDKIKSAQNAETEKRNQTLNEVQTAVKEAGLTGPEFVEAAEEVKAGLEDGTLTGQYTHQDIVDYAVQKKAVSTVREAIGAVDKGLASNEEFVGHVLRAVAKTEHLTGEKFTRKEMVEFVKAARDNQKARLRESLSRKASRAQKSGKTNSQSAKSQKQGKKESAGALTLRDHQNRMSDPEWNFSDTE